MTSMLKPFVASLSGNRSVALTLLLAGAEMNVQDKDGKTALMVAIINGHQDLVELLLQRNADITVKNLVNHVLLFISVTKWLG